jgi:hypothetical protein
MMQSLHYSISSTFHQQAKQNNNTFSAQRVLAQRGRAQKVRMEQLTLCSQMNLLDNSVIDPQEDYPKNQQEFSPLKIEEEKIT